MNFPIKADKQMCKLFNSIKILLMLVILCYCNILESQVKVNILAIDTLSEIFIISAVSNGVDTIKIISPKIDSKVVAAHPFFDNSLLANANYIRVNKDSVYDLVLEKLYTEDYIGIQVDAVIEFKDTILSIKQPVLLNMPYVTKNLKGLYFEKIFRKSFP